MECKVETLFRSDPPWNAACPSIVGYRSQENRRLCDRPVLKNPHTRPYWNASLSKSSSEHLTVSLLYKENPHSLFAFFRWFARCSPTWTLHFLMIRTCSRKSRDFNNLAKFPWKFENLQSGWRFLRLFVKNHTFSSKLTKAWFFDNKTRKHTARPLQSRKYVINDKNGHVAKSWSQPSAKSSKMTAIIINCLQSAKADWESLKSQGPGLRKAVRIMRNCRVQVRKNRENCRNIKSTIPTENHASHRQIWSPGLWNVRRAIVGVRKRTRRCERTGAFMWFALCFCRGGSVKLIGQLGTQGSPWGKPFGFFSLPFGNLWGF